MKNIIIKLEDLAGIPQFWARKLLPQPGKDRVNGLSDAIAEGVSLPPGYLFQDDAGRQFLVAGEGRRLAHKMRQKDMSFFVVTDEALAVKIVMQENDNRLQYRFKYQAIWDSCPLIDKIVEQSKRDCVKRLHPAPKRTEFAQAEMPEKIDDFAEILNCSDKFIENILANYINALEWDINHDPRKFGDSETALTALEFITSRVHDEDKPCSPGQAWAGIAGSDAGAEGQTKPQPKQLQLFCDGFASVGKWGKSFDKFEGAAKKRALASVKKMAGALPAELRRELLAELKRLDREEKP